jgi:hypothetical protein
MPLANRSINGSNGRSHALVLRDHTDSSNPTPSIGMDWGYRHGLGRYRHIQNPNILTTRATRKTTRFGQREAKCDAAGAMHRASMGATDGQRNFAEMRKTLGKPGVFSGEDRIRTTREIPRNGAFHYPARREIRRAQKTPLKTTRNGIATNHRSPR